MKSWPCLTRLTGVACMTFAAAAATVTAAPLDLTGYVDREGAITVQHAGGTIDPYFALQALLLAQEHGLDVGPHAPRWANWLVTRQKPDATFDRFCRNGPVWAPCKTADADDSLLALWLKFLETMPAELERNAAWRKSHAAAMATLTRLVDPRWHVYLVSPVYQHGLFMDNLEVWSYRPAHAAAEGPLHPSFGRSIHQVFWDEAGQRFLVSTQPEQRGAPPAFYPDAVAQIFPLVVGYTEVPGGALAWYRRWIGRHRAEWLAQVREDFAWGLIALVAWKQGDTASARCWLRTSQPFRHSPHWAVTDEVVRQVLAKNGIAAAGPQAAC